MEDAYATHLSFLEIIFKHTGKLNNIFEYGCGYNSTPYLIKNCNKLISIEMQSEEWFEKIKILPSSDVRLMLGYQNYDYITKIGEKFDMVFVDGHGSTRPECINESIKLKIPYIVAHDTEEASYGWNRVYDSTDYKQYNYKKYKNWTTLWTTDQSFYDSVKDFI